MKNEEILILLKGNITVVKDSEGNITFKVDNDNLKPYQKELLFNWLLKWKENTF